MFRLLQESEFLQWLFNRISNHTSCVLIHSASLRACSERALSWVKHMKHPESLVFFAGWPGHGDADCSWGSAFLSSFTAPEVNPSERKRWEDWETHSGAGIEQSGRFTGNKPNTPSSDWLHVQSPPANNNPLLFVHEIISNNQKELIARYVKTYESTIVLPQKCCWATGMIMKGLL